MLGDVGDGVTPGDRSLAFFLKERGNTFLFKKTSESLLSSCLLRGGSPSHGLGSASTSMLLKSSPSSPHLPPSFSCDPPALWETLAEHGFRIWSAVPPLAGCPSGRAGRARRSLCTISWVISSCREGPAVLGRGRRGFGRQAKMEKQPRISLLLPCPLILDPKLGKGGGNSRTTPRACGVAPGFAVLMLAELLGWVCFFKVSPRGRISQMRCGSSGNSSWLSAQP